VLLKESKLSGGNYDGRNSGEFGNGASAVSGGGNYDNEQWR